MALADIVARIADDARREADEIVLAAEREAERVREEAREHARREYEHLVEHGRAEAEAEARTLMATARLGARDRTLAEKRGLVQRVLDAAVARLETLPDEEYAALVAREVKRAARGGEQLVLGESDHRRLTAYLPPALAREGIEIEIAGSTAAIGSGALLLGERMRVEVSARALVDTYADRLTAITGETLFGDAAAVAAAAAAAAAEAADADAASGEG